MTYDVQTDSGVIFKRHRDQLLDNLTKSVSGSNEERLAVKSFLIDTGCYDQRAPQLSQPTEQTVRNIESVEPAGIVLSSPIRVEDRVEVDS